MPKKSIFTCEWCKKEFEEWTYRQPRFCSSQCRSEFGAKQPRPNKRKPKTMRVKRKCRICKKTFYTNIYQIILRNGGKFCSNECKYKANSIMLTNNNPNYKGGVSRNGKYFRGENWGSQRRKALKRDRKECQICHTTNRIFNRIEVHHIRPYTLFNGNYELANHLSNLITLCRKHHEMVEHGKIKCPKPKL